MPSCSYIYLSCKVCWSSMIAIGWWAPLGPKETTEPQSQWHFVLAAGNAGNLSSCQSTKRLEQAPGKGNTGKTLSTLSTCSLRQSITHQSIFFAFVTSDFSLILAWVLRDYSDEVSEIGRWHESLDYRRSKNDPSRTEDEKELNSNQGMSYWCNVSTAAKSHLRLPQRAPQCGDLK